MKTRLYPVLLLAALLMPRQIEAQNQDTNFIVIGDVTHMVQGGNLPYHATSACYTQQLVLNDELNGEAMITGIDLFCGIGSSSEGRPGCTIYLANTYVPQLTGMVPFSIQFQLVAVDSLVCTRGWNHYDFDTAFHYNGLGNLVVAFDCPYSTGGGEFFCELTQNISRYYGNRFAYFTPTSATNGVNYRNVMRLHTQPVAAPATTCPAPTLWVDSLGSTAVKVKWHPGYQDTSWTVEHITDGDTAWHSSGLVWGDTTYTITGLSPNTHYTVRLTAYCHYDSTAVLKHILTHCTPIALPYSEGFENTLDIPNCWLTSIGNSGNYPAIISAGIYNQNRSHTGEYGLELNGGGVILPAFDAPPDSLELSFWGRNDSGNNTTDVYIGVVSDPLDISTFIPIDTVSLIRYDDWTPWVVRFDRYSGTSGNIAIKSGTATPYIYLDDIRVNRIIPCLTIQTVNVDQITDSSAVVHWVDSSVYYEVAYGPSGFTIDSSHIVTGIWTDSLRLTELLPYTLYDVYVRSYCGSFNTNWSIVRSFRTQCSLITYPHYSVNFDSYADFLKPSEFPCWRGHVGTHTYVTHYSGGGHSGQKVLRWEWSSYDEVPNQYAILPAIDTSVLPINTLKLSFWAKNEEDQNNIHDRARIVVGVMSDPDVDSTFQPIDTVDIIGEDWVQYEVPFNSFNGTGMYITMKSCQGIGTNRAWVANIDDLLLNLSPPCPSVTGLVLSGLTSTSVTVKWNSRNSGIVWQTIIDTSDISPYSYPYPTYTSHYPTYTFTGLTAGTTYNVWVRAICPMGDTSYWEGPLQVAPGSWYMRANRKDTLTICGASLYDDGGPRGNISAYQRTSLVLLPDSPGHLVSVSGRCNIGSLSTLTIHDGISTAGSVLWTTGTNNNWVFNFGPVISDSGPITFALNANASTEGLNLYVSCIPDTCIIHHLQLDPSVPVSDTMLTLTWECNGASRYEVEHGPVGFAPGTGTLFTTSTNSFTITGLTSLERREVHVRSICGVDDTGSWVRGIFSTQPCSDAIFRVNYDSSMYSISPYGAPIGFNSNPYYYLQTLIDSAHLAGLESGITALAFHPIDYLYGDHMNNITVYLANVPDTCLNDGPIVPDSRHRFVKVIDSANFCHFATTEWQPYRFDHPFMWDGHQNLLVAVLNEDGGRGGRTMYSGHYRRTDQENGIMRGYEIYVNSHFSIDNARNVRGNGNWYTGDIRLYTDTCDLPLCAMPVVDAVTGNYEQLSLSWHGTGDNYQMTITPDTTGLGIISVNDNSYTFTGLQPTTTYQVSLRQDCSDDSLGHSDWVTIEFTGVYCPAPDSLRVIDITRNSATFDWASDESDTLWQLDIWREGERHVSLFPTSHPYVIEGLVPGTEYCAYIHSYCGSEYPIAGDWSDTVCFSTLLDSVGIQTPNAEKVAFSATIIPNPTKGTATLLLEGVPLHGDVAIDVTVSDVTGRERLHKKVPNYQYSITNSQISISLDLSRLPAGAYFIRVTSPQGSSTKKVLVIEN